MRCFIALLAILCLIAWVSGTAAPKQEIPAKFLASWSVDHSENFDEYLEAKGYGWFMRQMVKLASITKTFSKNPDGTYKCAIETTKKNVNWDRFELGKPFEAEYLDDSQHKILFTYDPVESALIEKHEKIGSDEKPDVYKYIIDQEGWLVMTMEYNGVKTKRFYKKN